MALRDIDTAPRNGRIIYVGDLTGNVAKAFWSAPGKDDGLWAYASPFEDNLMQQVDFEPTHWSPNFTDFDS